MLRLSRYLFDWTGAIVLRPRHLAVVLTLGLNAGCVSAIETDEIGALEDRLLHPQASDVIVVAHRGCWRRAPENSLEAIDACIDAGIDMIEIDVRRTKDGILVLLHDPAVDRTTNGAGAVVDLTLAELRALRLREGAGGDAAVLTDSVIPTLEEALQRAKGKILINLDCKATVYDDALALMEATRTSDQVLMKMAATANDPRLVNASFLGQTHFMPVISQKMGDLEGLVPMYDSFDPVAYEIVFADLAYIDNRAIESISGSQRVWVNTMLPRFSGGLDDAKAQSNPDEVWGRLIDLGFNMIQTDHPIDLVDYLTARNLRAH